MHMPFTRPPVTSRLSAIRYPEDLPVSQCKDELLAAIRDHQVAIVAGETGSGKTTQLPKICLELGRGVHGLIGHTQPRRLAARTIAERVAQELDTELGEVVGYQVRFTSRVGEDSYVKVMTDGILLAELAADRSLRRYDTLIIDEAHERSLNIDFILGYLKRLLPRRPDLKVIITSATIDAERFSAYFDGAPVLEVSGRTYPVEVRYRPYADDVDRDQTDAIRSAIAELRAEGPGDVLVFLSGERDIRETAEALTAERYPSTEILPLYARLPAAEQRRVFAPHVGRRIVLATNVAETSLTVPGVRFVVDAGTARVSRYSHRLKVQRLPVEPISQASANQRSGRCGRVAAGVCIRLYSEADFQTRQEYTDPEILRTNLASVILQMTAIGLGEVSSFPFLDPPDRRNITDGIQLLEELGALAPASRTSPRLTAVGRKLARLPLDPRLARMVLAAEPAGCVDEILVLAAALSIQDPRERPLEHRQAADAVHARFADANSDFLAYLNLWQHLRERQRSLSANQFRRTCRAEFLNVLRVREWQDLYSQLRQLARGIGLTGPPAEPPPTDASADAAADRMRRVHTAVLAGLLSHLGFKDPEKQDYLGARGARFAIFPGSGVFRQRPRWIMAAELVETSRLWGRAVGRIEPEWIEPLAGHLVKRAYSEPHWDARRGAVLAFEKVTLYGVPIVARRAVNVGRIDPPLARELFIRHALVEGDWDTRHQFFSDNQALLAEIEALEHRARRRDILVADETLFAFYDQRIPAEVVSGRHFDSWWKRERKTRPALLTFDRATLINAGTGDVSAAAYPDEWSQYGARLPLTYRFEPGTPADGVTVRLPLPLLDQVSADAFGWQVPGLREDLVTALIRSLPKELRRNFVPVPDYVREVLGRLTPEGGNLLTALERRLHGLTGVTVPRAAWQLDRVPDHLKMTYQVVDERDQPLAEGKNLDQLRQRLAAQSRDAFRAAAGDIECRGLRAWSIGTLQPQVEIQRGQVRTTGFPALVDEGDSVAVQVLPTPAEQRRAMWAGTRRLLLLTVPSPTRLVNARLSNEAKLALSRHPHRNAVDLLDDGVACAVDAIVTLAGGPAWDEAGFAALVAAVRTRLTPTVLDVVEYTRRILTEAHGVRELLARPGPPALAPAVEDMRSQLAGLVYRGFLTETGGQRLPDLHRYLRAMRWRLERLPQDPHRDAGRLAQVRQVWQDYQDLVGQAPPGARPAGPPGTTGRTATALTEIRWLVEELRVNLFAQAIGTACAVSVQRIHRAMDRIEMVEDSSPEAQHLRALIALDK
ncbi:MAG: ATP-dependent RNA helicase HrpA [Dactylosporangium sp.]|nr:ATP-dependent RNA helicase HrpA [Dactylosporangium sp.]NNJ59496.1 ATP-dependent RNA helicase HrpA [Dactylosporangium sp.]